MRRALFLLSVATLLAVTLSAQSPSTARPRSTFSVERAARIDSVLQQYVDDNRIAGRAS